MSVPSVSFRVHPWLLLFVLLAGCSPPTVPALPPVAVASEAPAVETPTHPRPPARRTAKPIEAIERVLIISIDGLRPDLALRAYMPRLRALCASGSYTFWAETAAEAYTLPCHVSMLTGVSSEKHGITWNEYIEEAWPNCPTLFELAHEVGYTTALVSGKMKFITLLKPLDVAQPPSAVNGVQGSGFRVQDDAESQRQDQSPNAQGPRPKTQEQRPKTEDRTTDNGPLTTDNLLFQRPSFRNSNTLDHYYLPLTEPISDHDVATEAVRTLRDHRPDVFFVHFPGADTVGHEHGWGTPQQIAAIEQADTAVGRLLDALVELTLSDQTLIILTADHGGAGLDHKAGDPRSHFVPWIISGPGIRRDYDLTLADGPVRIQDTFATTCALLKIATPPDSADVIPLPFCVGTQHQSAVFSDPSEP